MARRTSCSSLILFVIASIGFFYAPLAARATPVPYTFTLTVQSASDITPSSCGGGSLQFFPCATAPGDTFRGRFWVDDAVLSKTGKGISAPVTGFMLKIGSVTWDQDHPSDFRGLRDGQTYPSGGNALSFDINHGLITGIFGGVWGQSDPPYLDFEHGNTFTALDPGGIALVGITSVAPMAIAEPETVLLFLFGGGALLSRRLRLKGRPVA